MDLTYLEESACYSRSVVGLMDTMSVNDDEKMDDVVANLIAYIRECEDEYRRNHNIAVPEDPRDDIYYAMVQQNTTYYTIQDHFFANDRPTRGISDSPCRTCFNIKYNHRPLDRLLEIIGYIQDPNFVDVLHSRYFWMLSRYWRQMVVDGNAVLIQPKFTDGPFNIVASGEVSYEKQFINPQASILKHRPHVVAPAGDVAELRDFVAGWPDVVDIKISGYSITPTFLSFITDVLPSIGKRVRRLKLSNVTFVVANSERWPLPGVEYLDIENTRVFNMNTKSYSPYSEFVNFNAPDLIGMMVIMTYFTGNSNIVDYPKLKYLHLKCSTHIESLTVQNVPNLEHIYSYYDNITIVDAPKCQRRTYGR